MNDSVKFVLHNINQLHVYSCTDKPGLKMKEFLCKQQIYTPVYQCSLVRSFNETISYLPCPIINLTRCSNQKIFFFAKFVISLILVMGDNLCLIFANKLRVVKTGDCWDVQSSMNLCSLPILLHTTGASYSVKF